MKKVIVTGATGFIGRHFLKGMIEKNIEVYAIARKYVELDELRKSNNNNVHWIIGDIIEESENITHFIIQEGGEDADCFYHLAWNGVAACDKNDFDKQIKNIALGMKAMDICKNIHCSRFVNLGTVGEYVSLDGLINEKWVPSPADIYGAVKVAVRNILNVRAIQERIDMMNTILCSTYGEYRCDDNIISYTIKKLMKRECPEFGSLEQIWDFLYVEDVVTALYLIGEKGVGGKTYSIGSGVYRHLYEYIEIIRDEIDPLLPLGIGKLGNKYQKVLNSCVDTFQLQKDTGFKPRYTFAEGIRKTIRYFKEI